jgi:hypothetical protein
MLVKQDKVVALWLGQLFHIRACKLTLPFIFSYLWQAKAREAQRELEMAILAEALVSSRQQWRNLQPHYLNQAQKKDPASGLEIVEGLRNEIADRDHRLRCYRRQLQLFGVEDPENPHAPILAEDPRNPGGGGGGVKANSGGAGGTGAAENTTSVGASINDGAAVSPTTTSVNIMKVDHDNSNANDINDDNASAGDDQYLPEPLMVASLASLPPKPRPLSPGAAWEEQAAAPPPKAFPGAPTAPLTPFPVGGAGNSSNSSGGGSNGGSGGCLEQLEALVKHDKAILGIHNSVLFKRVELGMKRLLVEQRLTKLQASKRKGPGQAGSVWQMGDGSFVAGKKTTKGGPGDSDDDDDDDSVGRGDGGPGKGKLEIALKHYLAQLQRQVRTQNWKKKKEGNLIRNQCALIRQRCLCFNSLKQCNVIFCAVFSLPCGLRRCVC